MTRIDKIFYASGAPVTTDSQDQAMIVSELGNAKAGIDVCPRQTDVEIYYRN